MRIRHTNLMKYGIGITIIVIIASIFVISIRNNSRAFSSDIWQSWSVTSTGYNRENPRQNMVDDLLQKHIQIDTTKRGEIIELLGQPDEVFNGVSLSYYIGAGSSGYLTTSADYLILKFNDEGQLIAKTISLGG